MKSVATLREVSSFMHIVVDILGSNNSTTVTVLDFCLFHSNHLFDLCFLTWPVDAPSFQMPCFTV